MNLQCEYCSYVHIGVYLPGCLPSMILWFFAFLALYFYICFLEVYMPNSAIYLFLSSELVGAGAAVIGVVFVVQPVSFCLFS